MHKEIITCDKAVIAGNVSILPVIRLSLMCLEIKGSITFHATMQPEYVVVCRDSKPAIYKMTGEEITPSRARSECPGLDAALSNAPDFQLPYDC